MDIEQLRTICLSQKGATEDMPFGDQTLVFRVMNKIFALVSLDASDASINLKCDPEHAVELREKYPDQIMPGYHMNKKHWNTVVADQLNDALVRDLIQHSYELVVKSLPKIDRMALEIL